MAQRNAPTIDALLADALIQKVMRADHVEPQTLRGLLDATARRIASGSASSVQVGQDLGRGGSVCGPLLPMRPSARPTGGECGASLCG